MDTEQSLNEPMPAPPQPQPLPPQPAPHPFPQPRRGGGMIVGIIVIIVVVIIIMAAVLVVFNGNTDKNGDSNKFNEKYITAKEGKAEADKVALEWNENAVLRDARSFEGNSMLIIWDDWEWVEDYDVDTESDEKLGDGKCVAWEYEYYPLGGDYNERYHVIMFANGTVITWETEGGSTGTLNDGWNYDSDEAIKIAKSNSNVVNITSNTNDFTYIYYEIRPDIWDINFSNKTAHQYMHIDDENGEITYQAFID